MASRKTKKTTKKSSKKSVLSPIKSKSSKKSSSKSKPPKSSSVRKLRTEKDIAMDFASLVHKKFDRLVKASVLFGSQAKGTAEAASDIDIILVIDDASVNWDIELVSWYREELGKLVVSQDYSQKLHINTVKLTTFWQDLLYGDPVVINILRYGEVLIDYGNFFNPLKSLLLQGKIKSTSEAVYAALQRAPNHISRSKRAEISAIEGVYWAFIDASQAALIMIGKLPPSPEHIPQMLKENFVDRNLLKMEYVKAMRDLYDLHKDIDHGKIHDIKGDDIDRWQDLAEDFLMQITKIIDQLIESKKK